ncbi:MAG TPA: hypothetical protein VHM22_05375, partial [Bradyrhizobium sp.]|nr:hypothetical protein [Bradyrhizobium sp.]
FLVTIALADRGVCLMQSLTENLELLKNKALECELIAQLATDRIARAANLKARGIIFGAYQRG